MNIIKKNIIYIDGSFDLLHSGHIKFLNRIKKENDYLIVGIKSDKNIQSFKREPIISLEDRVIMLENIKAVDKVVPDCPFGKITKEFIDEHKINQVYYAGEKNTWTEHYKVPIDMGIMNYIDYSEDNLSTTKIINKIKNTDYKSDVDCNKVYVKYTEKKGHSAYANVDIKKGELIEKGLTRIVDTDGQKNTYLFTWSDDRKKWAFASGCITFYNTSRNPNTIMTRYFDKNMYEIHAKQDIKKDTELSHTYRSLEWREAFEDLRQIKDL
jgi:cytidyltransferase-like protein